MERTILHVDINSFYASVECLHRPALRHLPVAVGGDSEKRHGIILAKNELAKSCGVSTGETLWQARSKCPELVVVQPNFSQYERYSHMARAIFYDYSPLVEPFGLDEAWLDCSGRDGWSCAESIRRRFNDELGLSVSVGVSFNKAFAKLGSDYRKPDACTLITRENFRGLVWPLPVSQLLYVGRATTRKLALLGIHTIGQLAAFPLPLLQSRFGKAGLMIASFARGESDAEVKAFDFHSATKSIGNSSTLPRDLQRQREVEIVLAALCDHVGLRLRAAGLHARGTALSVRDSDLSYWSQQDRHTEATDCSKEIYRRARLLFTEHYDWGRPVRALGVSVFYLEKPTLASRQLSLFPLDLRPRALDVCMDEIRQRYGKESVRYGLTLLDPIGQFQRSDELQLVSFLKSGEQMPI